MEGEEQIFLQISLLCILLFSFEEQQRVAITRTERFNLQYSEVTNTRSDRISGSH